MYPFLRNSHGVYFGEIIYQNKKGKGAFLYPDGTYYEGDWEDDLRSGKGISIRPN
jgi:hypothetical protein